MTLNIIIRNCVINHTCLESSDSDMSRYREFSLYYSVRYKASILNKMKKMVNQYISKINLYEESIQFNQ